MRQRFVASRAVGGAHPLVSPGPRRSVSRQNRAGTLAPPSLLPEPVVVGRGVPTPPSATRTPPDLDGALRTARPTHAGSRAEIADLRAVDSLPAGEKIHGLLEGRQRAGAVPFTSAVLAGPRPQPGPPAEQSSTGERSEEGNRLPPVPLKAAEMPVGGANRGVGMEFRQTSHTGIREVHRRIGIGVEQLGDGVQFASQCDMAKTAAIEGVHHPAGSDTLLGDKMADFGQHGFAQDLAGGQPEEHFSCPEMMFIAWAKPGDERPSVQDDGLHLPKSSMCARLVERSVWVPLPMPQLSARRSARDCPARSCGSSAAGAAKIVSRARAFFGKTSAATGEMCPWSSSTSNV